MTYWGRYKKEQSFIAHPAKQRDVYRARMEDKYYASMQKPIVEVNAQEQQAESLAEETRKTGAGFWDSLLGLFSSKKEATIQQPKARWPAKTR